MTELEKNDIQGLVFGGYGKNPCACYALLEIVDPELARAWLGRVAAMLTSGDAKDYGTTVNLAISARGLSAIGLPADALDGFSREFREGMSGEEHRSRILGDTDESDPTQWEWGAHDSPVHLMLMLYARDDASLQGALASHRADYAGAVREVMLRDTFTLPERREHFGFADGIAQPAIGKIGADTTDAIKAGEFILGYPNEYDKTPVSPTVPKAIDPERVLQVAPTQNGMNGARDLGRNGTYLVVRQLEQRVAEFWNAMAKYSAGPSGEIDKECAIRLAAKCVGRWPSGAPLVKSPDRDDPALAEDDAFMYAKEDPQGLACPIGSHIRRTNPRDSLEPGPEDSLRVVDRHRIIRRGRSYGTPIEPFAQDDGVERGLFFICVNANIRRQFEFIQQTWSNNPKFGGLYADKDPLIGDQPPGRGGTYTIPEAPVRRRLEGLARFVRVRGGEYFFLPSIRAVQFLAALDPELAGADASSAPEGGTSLVDKIDSAVVDWLTSADTLRTICAELRELTPIIKDGKRVVVFRHDDVVDVLARNEAFGVADVYAARMERTTGAFFLGMEATAQYRREVEIARRAVLPDDASRIAQIARDTARELLDAARPRGTLDAVGQFSRLIPLRLLASYFGTPGPDRDTMKRWMRAIFWDIFLNTKDDPDVRERAAAASARLAIYLRGLLAQRRRDLDAGGSVPDDFVARLLRQQKADPSIDDDLLRRDIGGVIVGAVDTQSKAIAHSIDQLLRRPSAFASARAAALANDDVSVAAHVWEALRFNPHNSVLFRRCIADTVLGEGTERRTVVERGSNVIALTISAMFDPAAHDHPNEFSKARPPSTYLHFGHGQHTCFGERINRIVVPLAVKALLALPNLRYDDDGAIEYEGPFPDRMMLSFDGAR